MSVAIQNPSTFYMSSARIAVPHGHYKVEAFNKPKKIFETVQAEVVCHEDIDEKKDLMKSCFMNIELYTMAKDINLVRLTYDQTMELEAKSIDPIQIGAKIEDGIKLEWAGIESNSSLIWFNLIDEEGKNETLEFSLNWWASYIQYYDWDTSH